MYSTARDYFDATVALAIMATFGVIAGFIAFAATGDRALAMLASVAAFGVAGVIATIRLWRLTRKPDASAPTKPTTARVS